MKRKVIRLTILRTSLMRKVVLAFLKAQFGTVVMIQLVGFHTHFTTIQFQ